MAARWGSFLSQAVAGVEARLDAVLSENPNDNNDAANDATSAQPQQQQQSKQQQQHQQPPQQHKETKAASAQVPASPVKQSPAASRASSIARTNDRLQERLARAMAAKAAGQKPESPTNRPSISSPGSPRQSLDAPSRTSIDSTDPAKETYSPRGSQDLSRNSQDIAVTESPVAPPSDKPEPPAEEIKEPISAFETNGVSVKSPEDRQPSQQTPVTLPPPNAPAMAIPDAPPRVAPAAQSNPNDTAAAQESGQDDVADKKPDPHQEEIHGYVERIDALEAKLQFLAREATDAARKAALAAPAGSAEKKLAEKDQQIAQLMEEGKNLASTEQKHRAILKKLRLKIAEDDKELTALKAAREKSDKEIESLRLRARHADDLERAQADLQKRLDQAQKELATLRPDLRTKDAAIAELKAQLQKATEHADVAAAKAKDQPRDQDRRRIEDLEEEVAALRVEKNLVADRAKAQAAELREKAERASEKAKALELELKSEVQAMESKLEAMRMRAEEASSGVLGDSQAKLLRQMETLQSQYAIATENWQGIEATLLGRITGLERERDEALQRESDMRRKAREAAVRAKRHEEELEEAKTKIPTIQEDVRSYQAQLDALKARAEEAESALAKARAEFDKQKQAWEAEREEQRQARQVPDRRSWLEDLPGGSFLRSDSRPASPQLGQRTFSTDFLGIQMLTGSKGRKVSAPSSNGDRDPVLAAEPRGTFSRRPSGQPPTRPSGTPSFPGSSIFSPSLSVVSPTSETAPPLVLHASSSGAAAVDDDMETSSQMAARSNAGNTTGGGSNANALVQDMISVSTVAAGPSVQLVERMSAAIRRLESEKVAAKEELARISRQRDEARAEIVALMRDIEAARADAAKAEALEKEVAEVKARYETTLELLGEKSELVEELRADVEDVKAMYRDLVERTIK